MANVCEHCGTELGDGTLAAHKGPAQVATPAFRENWETLFGKRQPVGQA